MIDFTQIKPGDTVTLKEGPWTVARADSLHLSVYYGPLRAGWIPAALIASHTPAKLEAKVGDRATGNGYTGRVIAVHNGWAWLSTECDGETLVLMDELTVLEEPTNGEA